MSGKTALNEYRVWNVTHVVRFNEEWKFLILLGIVQETCLFSFYEYSNESGVKQTKE